MACRKSCHEPTALFRHGILLCIDSGKRGGGVGEPVCLAAWQRWCVRVSAYIFVCWCWCAKVASSRSLCSLPSDRPVIYPMLRKLLARQSQPFFRLMHWSAPYLSMLSIVHVRMFGCALVCAFLNVCACIGARVVCARRGWAKWWAEPLIYTTAAHDSYLGRTAFHLPGRLPGRLQAWRSLDRQRWLVSSRGGGRACTTTPWWTASRMCVPSTTTLARANIPYPTSHQPYKPQ